MDALTSDDPTRIGPFRLIGRLGTGGMGRVYLARSEGGRTVAVKVVHAQLAEQDEFRRRFAREVAALERVGGAGTAPVIDSDTAADAPWVALTYVPGPSLRNVVGEEYGPLPAETVLALASRLADALTHIHRAGLVHRDLKPSNILLTVDGPRIIDFGIARAVDTVTDGGLTSTGAVVGSPGFMSPEQVRGEKLTPASDLFCLGAVLAYAATGVPPFGSAESGAHATMFRIAHDEPDLTGLPCELEPLVRACLDKDPHCRPPASVLAAADHGPTGAWLPADVLARLGRSAARLLDADTPVPGAGDPTPAEDPAPPRRPRRGRVLAAVLAAVLLAAGGVGAAAFWPEKKQAGGDKRPTSSGSGADDRPAGDVPQSFVGAWEGVLDGTADAPYSTGRIEIAQGRTGEKTAVYVTVTGERLCMGRSVLVSADADRIVFGESDVTLSVPEKQCTPAAHQTLTVRSPDVLEWTSGAATATFRKAGSGPEAVPSKFLGTWTEDESGAEWGPGQAELFERRVTVTQGPVGSAVVRYESASPRTDETTGEPVGGTVNCASTAVLGGVGGLVVVGPPVRDAQASDPECTTDTSSQNLRTDRFEGKERLLVYGMSADGEPGTYLRN
ncbi:serine/threonine protein kinase [Streptomyces sp. PKU-EA00015]|uniref:serine/threonine-protein kinase n=1 Tax=Streptomyces sp. PKU-EA00015 TaxID=2748326 RepID=UPI00159FF22B|nr:serine/threonine-protein kinase [Streptomyces sp. PKU-EA00015]NWF27177.1 serine/threonine protein kinase [Streptomyces sp. PKU-EA00015]